jgi:hypothetical protein
MPPGLSLSAAGQLSGNPATAGTFQVSVTVSDSSMPPGTTTASVSVNINDTAIVIASATPPAGTVTYPYPGVGFSASGGSPPYTWTTTGTFPPGLVLGNDGSVSGTPTQAGTFSFSVIATDSAQPPTSAPPFPTSIMIGTPPALTLNASPAPPAGLLAEAYGPFSFSESGGYLPLHWSITAGALPPGITLGNDGSLSGTPTSLGASFAFTVTVTDSAQPPASSSQPFTIGVTEPPPPSINPVEPPTGIVGSAYMPNNTPFQFNATGGAPPLTWSEAGPLAAGLSLAGDGTLGGTPTAYGQYPVTINVMDVLHQAAQGFATVVRVSQARSAAFATTGSMSTPRSGHRATLLLSGKVLVTGGGNGTADSTAELYDPATGTFSPTTGNMTEARSVHTATLLKLADSGAPNYGKVLIVGSVDTTAELYDPTANTFSATGSLHHARTSPTATFLSTGKVLIVGGNSVSGDLVAELYDPASGTFSDTGSTTTSRNGHTATLLLDGHVLITGGGGATAELYDPKSGTFTQTAGPMTRARSGHTATLLEGAEDTQFSQNGYVLILGTEGYADLYNPGMQTFEGVGSWRSLFGNAANVLRPTINRTANLRNDGTVVTVGGNTPVFSTCHGIGLKGNSSFYAALFAPESDGFTFTGNLHTSRDTHTATLLQDGSVLVIGGTHRFFFPGHCGPFGCSQCITGNSVLSSAEVLK